MKLFKSKINYLSTWFFMKASINNITSIIVLFFTLKMALKGKIFFKLIFITSNLFKISNMVENQIYF